MTPARRLPLLVAALALVPIAESRAQVAFERAGFRLTSIGERITVSGRVVDARRRPVANTSIRWRVADPSIATVTPQGVVVSRRVGNTKLWAVAGEDSASALILVDQWAAKFDFLPATVRLHAVGAKSPLKIIVRDASGHPIASQNRKPAACRSVNDAVATLAQNGDIIARANGVTYVRCADRGIADSVRIEVRQRPAKATIADKLSFGTKVLGDTFRIRVRATDASGDAIANVQASWASLNPTIVSVDPLNGFARGVGTGTAKIVVQAGDVMDTVTVGVAPAVGLAVPDNADVAAAAGSSSTRMPTIKIDAVYPIVGDTVTVRLTVRDATGTEIPNPTVRLESSDSTVFDVISRGRVATKRDGSAFVRVHFGEVVDSGQIIVRARTTLTTVATTTEAPRTFTRPTFNTDSFTTAYNASRDSINKLIFDSTRVLGLKAPWLLLAGSVSAGQSTHSFSDSTGTEKRSGFVYGGILDIRLFRYVKLSGEFRTGILNASGTTGGTALAVTEAGGTLAVQAAEAFAFGGTFTKRATREGPSGDFLGIQQWSIPRVFVTLRPAFVGGAVRTIMGVNALLPGAKYSGYVDAQGNELNPEALSLGGEAGLEFRTGGFRVGLIYNVESFRFPKVGTSVQERRDQFSTIRLRAGWEYDR